ncbi:MAG: hypothetical protein HDR05_12495 [Lachnospiraceae bacterium]|nr:hypothetical protein [Lachnospiraceae bacterium]
MKRKPVIIISIIGVIAIALVILFACQLNNRNRPKYQLTEEEQQLIEETPLTEYSYWYSLDKFPRYKVEAAQKVEQLMSNGVSQEEACEEAINEVSDKIYNDTVYFIENNTDITSDNWEEAYYAYMEQTQ